MMQEKEIRYHMMVYEDTTQKMVIQVVSHNQNQAKPYPDKLNAKSLRKMPTKNTLFNNLITKLDKLAIHYFHRSQKV